LHPTIKRNDLEQIDGVVYVNGLACLVECKDYQKAINFEPIAKLRSQLMRRPSTTIASIFSIEGFTEPASILLDFIHPQTILAWEKNQIGYCLREKFSVKPSLKNTKERLNSERIIFLQLMRRVCYEQEQTIFCC